MVWFGMVAMVGTVETEAMAVTNSLGQL